MNAPIPSAPIHTRSSPRCRTTAAVMAAGAGLLLQALPLRADLFSNLQSFPARLRVGDPGVIAADGVEGPKGIATADFNGDTRPDLAASNLDGTITVLLAQGGGFFAPPRHLNTAAKELRGVLAADLNNDGQADIAAASPEDGQLMVFFNLGAGVFGPKVALPAWVGVRGLAAGDFDGDGKMDLAAAGPGMGVRHFRGTGGGAFEIMGDNLRLSPKNLDLTHPRPVYALRTLRSRDGLRDDLLVTHADSPVLWILSTVVPDRRNEPPVLTRVPAWQASDPPVVLNEVQLQNTKTLRDADGTTQPWAELLNQSDAPVNLAGWQLKLSTATWYFPEVTIAPGRFLVVFLSSKNRTGAELHTSFLLKQSTDALNLIQANGLPANTIDLPKHEVTDVSRGLAPDNGVVKWCDLPSPGAENNAGITDLDNLSSEVSTMLTLTPPVPAPGQSVTVRVATPEKPTGSTSVRAVWFSATPGLTEVHHLMHRTAAGVFEEVLPADSFRSGIPHRVLARIRDDGTSSDYTVEIFRGTGSAAGSVPVRPGGLVPVASVPSPRVKSFETGPLFAPVQDSKAHPDLLFADNVRGWLRLHRAAPDARRFEPVAARSLQVAGLPRDVKLADMDTDGWLDAVVVLQEADAAVVCRNSGGTLQQPAGELSTGNSPREAVVADFTGDGRPDAAVINRYSRDVSILAGSTTASGLVTRDHNYSVDGDVAAMTVQDFNGDTRADVLQLHRASSEISLRTAAPDGRLSAPAFWPVGASGASAMAIADMNNDGTDDVVTANLGLGTDGSISVLRGTAGGGFLAPLVFHAGASLFAIAVADFNNDGNHDVVAGLWDCRAKFLFGDGQGSFTVAYELPVPFVNESRVMVTKDFDQDGDMDIAGAGIEGDMVTLENTGATTGASWIKRAYASPSQDYYGANRIGVTNLNDDGDPDLIIGTGSGMLLYEGLPGMAFRLVPPAEAGDPSTGLPYAISDVFTADIDGDGALDMVAACRAAACLDVLSQGDDGLFVRTLQVDVPSSRFIATGDLDGDGKPDLVGTGDVLWTVLSSHPPQIAAPNPGQSTRPQTTGIVINEVQARNKGVSVPTDNNRNSDYVEIFNGGNATAELTGWKLRVQSNQEGTPLDQTWQLPSLLVSAQGRTVIVFAEFDPLAPSGTSPRTGFELPAEGGTITLLRPDTSTADQTVYPHAQEDVSWSRYLDGHPSFHADPVPTPGLSNADNGGPPPEVTLTPPSPASLRPGVPIKFTARGRDDLGIITMSLIWNRLDAPYPEPRRLNLYDDGLHGDGPSVDGVFAGTLPSGLLPNGAQVQFYLEAVDLSGETLRLPEVAELSAPGDPPAAWSFTISDVVPALEISEVCASNSTLLRDERGGHPDYIKVRNTGPTPVDLSRILLAQSPLSENIGVYAFPSGLTLAAGAEITIFADGKPSEGPLHAPFSLSADGDDLSLFAVLPSGARQWIHSLAVPPSGQDMRFMRLPGSTLRGLIGTNANFDAWSGTVWDANGAAFAAVRFFAASGTTYDIEGDAAAAPVAWSVLQSLAGNNTVRLVTWPLANYVTLRAVIPSRLAVRVDAALPGYDPNTNTYGAAIHGTVDGMVTGPFEAKLYYGLNASLTSPVITLPLTGPSFQFQIPTLAANTLYYYRVFVSSGRGGVWSGPPATFRTPAFGTLTASGLQVLRLTSTTASIAAAISGALLPGTSVSLFLGTQDHFANVAAWPRSAPLAPTSSWQAQFDGLIPGTEYFVRAVISSPAGTSVSAELLRFRASDANNPLTGGLRISEIMYHPAWPTDAEAAAGFAIEDFEFIELHNPSATGIDLSGMWFEGTDFDFPPSGAPVIPPGGYAVIATNPHAFAMRYGVAIPLAAWTLHPFRSSKLSNGGQVLALHRADGSRVVWASYVDWPWETDGDGYSLEWLAEEERFLSSLEPGGTPGAASISVTYSEWTGHHFTPVQIADPAISGASADPDNDGLNNFAEFATGTSPLVPGSPDVLSIHDGGIRGVWPRVFLSFPVNRAARNTRFTLQVMTSGWTDVGTYFTTPPDFTDYYHPVIAGSYYIILQPGNGPLVTVTIAVPLHALPGGNQSRRVFRLKISSP